MCSYIKPLLLALAIGICITIFHGTALATTSPCDTRDNLVALLADKYNEHRTASGVTNNGGLVEVFESRDGSTWKILLSNPQGFACVVAAGEAWKSKSLEPAGQAS